MREKHSLRSYYFRSFICLQIGTNFQCRFKKIVGMWANILFKKFSVLFLWLLPWLLVEIILRRPAVFPSSSDPGWRCAGPKECHSAGAQHGVHQHCLEGILALSPCLSRISKGGSQEAMAVPAAACDGLPWKLCVRFCSHWASYAFQCRDPGHSSFPAHTLSSNRAYAGTKSWWVTGRCS